MNKKVCKKCLNRFNRLNICDECLQIIADDMARDVAKGVWEGVRKYVYGGGVGLFLAGMLIGYLI